MQSTEYIIQLARERALFGFSALLDPVIQDAQRSIAGAVSTSRLVGEQNSLWLAGNFLRQDGELLRKRFEAVFRDYLDRAMRTMYRDLRMRLGAISANELSLIDDDTVNRELEVDRLLLRLREANDESLTRINIIIAQMHGHKDVRERENPFRPYLIARSLHQVLLELVSAEAVVKILFEHLSNALANHLSAYYEAIRTVFESRGIRAKLVAQPGRLVKHQRYVGGGLLDGDDQLHESSRVELGFQNMMEVLPHAGGGEALHSSQGPGGTDGSAQELQDFVRRIFARSKDFMPASGLSLADDSTPAHFPGVGLQPPALKPASPELLSLVERFQQQAAAKPDAGQQGEPAQFELFDLNQQIDADQASKMERVTIDVVGMLFQYLLEDEQIPKAVRDQIGRLQIPFLKVAMRAPEVLQQAEHPARKLLNRMSSVAVGMDLDTPAGGAIMAEMARLVEKVRDEFDEDNGVFTDCLMELETALARQLSTGQTEVANSVARIEAAEHTSEQLTATVISLRRFLQPLIIDERAFQFICGTWARVLCQELSASDSGGANRFRDLIPDLLWSIQEKLDAAERSALIHVLPDLVKQLKNGMLTIHLTEDECQHALDRFVALHMEVLRGNKSAPQRRLFGLDELRRYFSTFVVGQECDPPALPELDALYDDRPAAASEAGSHQAAESPQLTESIDALEIRATALESALAEHGIASDLESSRQAIPAFDSDADWMAQMQLGVCVERWADGSFQIAHLAWISRNRALYLFRDRQTDRPFVFSAPSLLKGLREGSVRTVEYAPAFDRAVDALLQDAGTLQIQSDRNKPPVSPA